MRNDSFADRVQSVPLHPGLTRRDQTAVERLASGLIKVLYPDGNLTDPELLELVEFACELRQRVHQQLCALAPGEFKPRLIAPASIAAHTAQDLQPRQIKPAEDRLNTEAVVGAVTGLAVLSKDGQEVGGDVMLIQVSALNGSPTVEVTGLHGGALRDSVRAVYNLVRANFREFGIPEQRLKTQTVAVHLVKIAEPKDGPSAGVAFVVGIVSALANRPVKPGWAFTGEVALHGEVGPVGGLNYKIAAAAQAGRKHVIIPAVQSAIINDLPAEVKAAIEVHPVATAREALALALVTDTPTVG
jgi:ATP-dependent Lon protease